MLLNERGKHSWFYACVFMLAFLYLFVTLHFSPWGKKPPTTNERLCIQQHCPQASQGAGSPAAMLAPSCTGPCALSMQIANVLDTHAATLQKKAEREVFFMNTQSLVQLVQR